MKIAAARSMTNIHKTTASHKIEIVKKTATTLKIQILHKTTIVGDVKQVAKFYTPQNLF